MLACVLGSIFVAIFLFQVLTWWKAHIFFTNTDHYFSSGNYSFVFMIIFIILLLISSFIFFIKQKRIYALIPVVLLVLVSFTYLTNYIVIKDKGWESYLFFIRTDKVSWEEIDKIETDYQMNTTRGTFSPSFSVTTAKDKESIDVGKWGNIITSKPEIWDFSASGWVSGEEGVILRLREVKMMEFIYQHAPGKLDCVQREFETEKPNKQIEAWEIFAKNFVEPEICEFK
jgi:hypothetical protein